MDNIIIVEGQSKYTFGNKADVLKKFFGEKISQMSDDEKYEMLKLRTLMNATFRGLPVKDLKKGEAVEDINESQYIIYDEESFLLSLAKNNDIVIYEHEKAEEFSKGINKDNLERVAKEYIRINDCANEILQNKIKDIKVEKKIKDNEKGEREDI